MKFIVNGRRVVFFSSYFGDDISRQWFYRVERVFIWNVINLLVNKDFYDSLYIGFECFV